MSNSKLAADHRDQVTEIRSMAHVAQQRLVLLVDRLPIRAMHLRIVEILTLDAPCFAIDLRPLGARIDAHLQLGYVQWSITNLCRPFSRDHAPTVCAITRLI